MSNLLKYAFDLDPLAAAIASAPVVSRYAGWVTGAQDYATLTTNGGTTNLEVVLGTGSPTLNANAATNITVSQTLAALNMRAGSRARPRCRSLPPAACSASAGCCSAGGGSGGPPRFRASSLDWHQRRGWRAQNAGRRSQEKRWRKARGTVTKPFGFFLL